MPPPHTIGCGTFFSVPNTAEGLFSITPWCANAAAGRFKDTGGTMCLVASTFAFALTLDLSVSLHFGFALALHFGTGMALAFAPAVASDFAAAFASFFFQRPLLPFQRPERLIQLWFFLPVPYVSICLRISIYFAFLLVRNRKHMIVFRFKAELHRANVLTALGFTLVAE